MLLNDSPTKLSALDLLNQGTPPGSKLSSVRSSKAFKASGASVSSGSWVGMFSGSWARSVKKTVGFRVRRQTPTSRMFEPLMSSGGWILLLLGAGGGGSVLLMALLPRDIMGVAAGLVLRFGARGGRGPLALLALGRGLDGVGAGRVALAAATVGGLLATTTRRRAARRWSRGGGRGHELGSGSKSGGVISFSSFLLALTFGEVDYELPVFHRRGGRLRGTP